jgi:hypothetical protein
VLAPAPIAPAAADAAPVITAVSDVRLDYIRIIGTLPEAGNDLPPELLDSLNDLVPVHLDLRLNPPLEPSARAPDGTYSPLPDCGFGVAEAAEISVPTGSNHMLLAVRMGTPEAHPANLLSCEYDPAILTDDRPGTSFRLRGCFLPQSVSIPTAVLWVLNPLPASACGLGD